MVCTSLETFIPRAERGESRVAAKAVIQVPKYSPLLLKGMISPCAEPEWRQQGLALLSVLSCSGPVSTTACRCLNISSRQQEMKQLEAISLHCETMGSDAGRVGVCPCPCSRNHVMGTNDIQLTSAQLTPSEEAHSHPAAEAGCPVASPLWQWGSAPVPQNWLLTIWHRNYRPLRHHGTYVSGLLKIFIFMQQHTTAYYSLAKLLSRAASA